MSPEQTGRMNRTLDYRTDFYSLGITLYELFTGQRPFVSEDPLKMIHFHVAKRPIPPDTVKPEIPAVISKIILKLVEKNADDRYQSALGVQADFIECLKQLESRGSIVPFPLAREDISDRFHLPSKLYGREEEVALLTDAFKGVSEGGLAFTLVAGYSGVGKSSLVEELFRSLVETRGRYLRGKYDQFQREVPYSGLVAAFTDFCNQLLSESTSVLNTWRRRILDSIKGNGQVIIDVIPRLEKIIGPQPVVVQIDPIAAQNRFNLAFQDLIGAICRPEEPLVLFLDDLQWADTASLLLLKVIVSNSRLKGLHLVGAYRDNEVEANSPLMLMVNEIIKSGGMISTVKVTNLSLANIVTLLCDALSLSSQSVANLADIIYSKTQGNAFFIAEFLKVLVAEGLLYFSHSHRQWEWNADEIIAKQITANVVDLMVGKIKLLPQETQNLLKLAACLGSRVNLQTLAIVSEKFNDVSTILEHLAPAFQQGVLLPEAENFKTAGVKKAQPVEIKFSFQHDRVQQAAYSLIPSFEKSKVHLNIGRLLLKSRKGGFYFQDDLFNIVSHLNKGILLIYQLDEKFEVAALNFQAGLKAKKESAYLASVEYLTTARNLLPESSFETDYRLSFDIHLNLANEFYIVGNSVCAEAEYITLFNKDRTVLDTVRVYTIQMDDYHLQGKYEKAIVAQKTGLSLLGEEIPETDQELELDIEKELKCVPQNLGLRSIAELIEAGEIHSPEINLTLRLLMGMWMSAYLVSKESIVQWSSIRMANLCLKYGNSEIASFAFIQLGYVYIVRLQKFQEGYDFGAVALKLSDRYPNLEIRGKTYFMFGLVISHWKKHISYSTAIFRKAYLASIESGD